MPANQDEVMLMVLVEQNLITSEQASACLKFQEEYQKETGTFLPLPKVLLKLQLLSKDQIGSLLRAFKGAPGMEGFIEEKETPAEAPEEPKKIKTTEEKKKRLEERRKELEEMKKKQELEDSKSKKDRLKEEKLKKLRDMRRREETEEEAEEAEEDAVAEEVPGEAIEEDMPDEEASEEAEEAVEEETEEVEGEKEEEKPIKKGKVLGKPLEKEQWEGKKGKPIEKVFARLKGKVSSLTKVESSLKDEDQKSLSVAYFLLIFFGVVGAHRFYIRRYRSAILYLLTFGFLGIGILVDLFLTFFLVKKHNRSKTEDICASEFKEMEEYKEVEIDGAPEWDTEPSSTLERLINIIDKFCRIGYFWAAPLILGIVAFYVKSPVLIIISGVLLAIIMYQSRVDIIAKEHSFILQNPFIYLLHNGVLKIRGFYFKHKPQNFFYYLFSPVSIPVGSLVNKTRRKESYLYLAIYTTGMFLSGCFLLYNYLTYYYPYDLTIIDFLTSKVVTLYICIASFLIFFMPLANSIFYFSAKGETSKRAKLPFITCALLIICFVAVTLLTTGEPDRDAPTRMDLKLQKESVRNKFKDWSIAFLDKQKENLDRTVEKKVFSEEEITKDYQSFIANIAPGPERFLFKVHILPDQTKQDSYLLWIEYRKRILLGYDSWKSRYTQWEQIRWVKGIESLPYEKRLIDDVENKEEKK